MRLVTGRWHKVQSSGHAEYARNSAAGKGATYEGEWKRRLANKTSTTTWGEYAKGEYAMNDTDWEKKLGGYPADMVAAEKKQKVDAVVEKKVHGAHCPPLCFVAHAKSTQARADARNARR